MADSLSLLFRLKAQNETGPAIKAAQADVQKLKQSFGPELQTATRALSNVTQNLTANLQGFSSRVPVVGTAVNGLSNAFSNLSSASTSVSAGVAGVAAGAGVAVVAVGALIAVTIKAAEAFFNLTKQTAEFQGKFRDLSQQVGVSSETLSTLAFFAETTGGNIETVTASLGIFQKHLEAAHDPTSKEAKLLKELGVTSLDTETALRQTIRGLFNLGEGSRQTAAALELFGRSGRFVNAITKEAGGNFEEAGEKAAQFGRLVTTEAAIAADQFNDSLIILQSQLAGIGRQLTQDSIPVFIAFFDEISKALTGNAADWKTWSEEIARFTAFVLANLKTVAEFAASGFTLPIVAFDALLRKNFESLLKASEKLRNQFRVQADLERLQSITGSILDRGRVTGSDGKDKVEDRAAKSIALAQSALEESTRANRVALERERDLDLKSITEWKDAAIKAHEEHQKKLEAIYDEESANVRRFVKSEEDAVQKQREIQQKRTKLINDTAEAIQKVQDEAQRREDQAELRLNQQLLKLSDALRKAKLDEIKRLNETAGLESEVLATQARQREQQHIERITLIDLELKQETTSAERRQELGQDRLEEETKFTSEFRDLIQKRIAAMQAENAALQPRPGAAPSGKIGERLADLFPESKVLFEDIFEPAKAEITSLDGALLSLGDTIEKVFGLAKGTGVEFANTLRSAIDSFAFAVGDLVGNWVLLGETGPNAMRKLTASVLAGLAAQATTKAIFQLAEGFAMLFVNPAQAAAHFKSAALFGAVAGVAAVAGRSVAGDLFKPQSRGAGDGAGSSGGSGQLNPLALQRNAGPLAPRQEAPIIRPPTVNITVKVVPDGTKFAQAVDAHVVEDFNNAGPIREVISGDGNLNRG